MIKIIKVLVLSALCLGLLIGCNSNENTSVKDIKYKEITFSLISFECVSEFELNDALYKSTDGNLLSIAEVNIKNMSDNLININGKFEVEKKRYDATIVLNKGGLNVNTTVELNPNEEIHLYFYSEMSKDEIKRVENLTIFTDDNKYIVDL